MAEYGIAEEVNPSKHEGNSGITGNGTNQYCTVARSITSSTL
jgi:hypothetical protein